KPLKEEVKKLPLRKVWEEWYDNRPKKTRDTDGLELLRASILLEAGDYEWDEWKAMLKKPAFKPALKAMLGGIDRPPKMKYEHAVSELLDWLLRLHPVGTEGVDWLLDATETAYAMVPEQERARVPKKDSHRADWRNQDPFVRWLSAANDLRV